MWALLALALGQLTVSTHNALSHTAPLYSAHLEVRKMAAPATTFQPQLSEMARTWTTNNSMGKRTGIRLSYVTKP